MSARRPAAGKPRLWGGALIALIVVIAGGSYGLDRLGGSLLPESWTETGVSAAVESSPEPGPGLASAGPALDVLAGIPVRGRAPKTGYDRVGSFGSSWFDEDRNGCDTRNDILARDLSEVTTRGGCRVLTGVLDDPYTGDRITFERGSATSSAVQIDHVVALMNAWQTGAQNLDADARRRFANDPLNLLAVDGPANQQKGAADAATWLPKNRAFRCAYVARQVSVKSAYGLWMTAAEHEASARVLGGCPGQEASLSPLSG